MSFSDTTFPTDLPKPEDDGACNHLPGTQLPSVNLPATSGHSIDIATLSGLTVLFAYPRTGAPNEVITDDWNAIPGARGCTPQACSFRDASDELASLGVQRVFGVSTQDTEYQREIKNRVHLQYELLSDERGELREALRLPTFEWKGTKLIKRMSLIIDNGKIIKVFYPVFPPDGSAEEVLKWLRSQKSTSV